MKSWFLVLVLTCAEFLISGCGKEEHEGEGVLHTFTVKGVVKSIEDEGRTLVIKHEEMPGYMGAMTMPFRVKEPTESKNISAGDEIRFTYKVAELSSWIEDLHPTGRKEAIEESPLRADQSSRLLKAGEQFPDFELTNEHGEIVRLRDHRGDVVALTFIFTRCPVPEYCPTMMRNFKEVDALLKKDPRAPDNYHLLTVSFDSDYDTPEVLKAYGDKFDQDSRNWTLLTSSNQTNIQSLGQSVGLMFGKNDSAIYSHNLRTVVIDGTGRITRIFTDESWKAETLVAEIKAAATKDCEASETAPGCCATEDLKDICHTPPSD